MEFRTVNYIYRKANDKLLNDLIKESSNEKMKF